MEMLIFSQIIPPIQGSNVTGQCFCGTLTKFPLWDSASTNKRAQINSQNVWKLVGKYIQKCLFLPVWFMQFSLIFFTDPEFIWIRVCCYFQA